MADTKITALTAITSITPATFPLPIVDLLDTTMAGSGTTKKVTVNQILGCGGTATLASATITGALTANGGISMANATAIASSGAVALYVDTNQLVLRARATNGILFQESTGANNLLTISNAGVFGFLDGAGGTRMTLNSTGLGVGGSPTEKLSVNGSLGLQNGGTQRWHISATSGSDLVFTRSTVADRFTITSDGNVGIGVTPSAWGAGIKGLELGSLGSGISSGGTFGGSLYATMNAYNDGSWKFARNADAGLYGLNSDKSFAWYQSSNAPSVGGNISWNQAMTLTAVGELLVGTTSVGGVFDTKFYLSSNSGTNKWAVGPYGTATNFAIIPTPGTGGVYLSGTSATSWTAYSDERLKDIIEPITNALAKVGSLRSVIGKFKGDEANTRRPFLIAQDLQSALPEAVDASNPDRLGVAYTDVIPLLVAAIKELTARVQTLETR